MNHDFTPFSSDRSVVDLLHAGIGRILTNRGETVASHPVGALRHIADWLEAAVRSEASWLKNVDEAGRPKKLMKCSTIEGLSRQADRAMAVEAHRLNSRRIADAPLSAGETVAERLADGYAIVEMTTPEALDRESAMMGHCIGNGAYDERLGCRRYLSLRDAAGRSHVTMEIDGEEIAQLRGKQNRPPVRRYLAVVGEWIFREQLILGDGSSDITDLVQDVRDRRIHPIDAMPDGISSRGSLTIAHPTMSSLPQAMRIGGDLDLSMACLETLPDGLVVEGDLFLRGCPLTTLPDDIEVRGDIFLSESSIRFLPKNLKVRGNLYLGRSKIEELPEGLVVEGNLDASHTKLKMLPEDLVVGKELRLNHTPMEDLPDNLAVGGSLYLGGSSISRLPAGLRIGGGLFLRDTPIDSLPENLTVRGNLNLMNTPIVALPAGLTVTGNLCLDKTGIDRLPEDIVVQRQISCRGAPLEAFACERLPGGRIRVLPSTQPVRIAPNVEAHSPLSVDPDGGLTLTEFEYLLGGP